MKLRSGLGLEISDGALSSNRLRGENYQNSIVVTGLWKGSYLLFGQKHFVLGTSKMNQGWAKISLSCYSGTIRKRKGARSKRRLKRRSIKLLHRVIFGGN